MTRVDQQLRVSHLLAGFGCRAEAAIQLMPNPPAVVGFYVESKGWMVLASQDNPNLAVGRVIWKGSTIGQVDGELMFVLADVIRDEVLTPELWQKIVPGDWISWARLDEGSPRRVRRQNGLGAWEVR